MLSLSLPELPSQITAFGLLSQSQNSINGHDAETKVGPDRSTNKKRKNVVSIDDDFVALSMNAKVTCLLVSYLYSLHCQLINFNFRNR